MRLLFFGLAIAAMLSLGLAQTTYAQEPAATPTVFAAAECTVAPISFERLTSLIATPIAETASVVAGPTAVGIPDGEPADDATVAVVLETIVQLVACINAGDSLRGLAVYSDRFVQAAFEGVNITQEMYDAEALNLQPRDAGSEVILHSFGEVVLLEDGRAALIVIGDDLSSPEAASRTLFYLINRDGMWYVDETVEDVTWGLAASREPLAASL